MPIDLALHRALDAASLTQPAAPGRERFPWKWEKPHGAPSHWQVWINEADAELIVQMRNDHMEMVEEIERLRDVLTAAAVDNECRV